MSIQIKIDNEVFEVPEKVYKLFIQLEERKEQAEKQEKIHFDALRRSTEMIYDCKYLVGRLLRGEKITVDKELWVLGAELEKELNAEVKNGMAGWLAKNWGKICSVACDCGSLISYDVLRESNELLCKKCYSKQQESNKELRIN